MNFMSLLSSGGGGGGASAADFNPYSKAIKAAGVQMEATGRGMATANPRISAALGGAAAGEHSAYARMAQRRAVQDASGQARNVFGNRQTSRPLFGTSENIQAAGLDDPNHGGF